MIFGCFKFGSIIFPNFNGFTFKLVVIIKIDNLREDLEENLNRISPPEADHMAEFKKFIEQIAEFKGNPTALVAEAKHEIAEAVSEALIQQHEELKSMLAVSINNEEIIAAIEELKACFYARIDDLSAIQQPYAQEEETLDDLEEFSSNQYEKAFETDKNAEIISELKEDFDKFSDLIKDLSEENTQISEVLEAIKTDKYGKDAAIIGEVIDDDKVLIETGIGGVRILETPIADPVPRVC